MLKAKKSINYKKLVAVLVFVIPLIADWLIPGAGIAIELVFLLWELLQAEEKKADNLPE
ncbi:hypothetical protein NIES2100_28880 [Calothrix sp. NIES-2100]|uniref:hypothetical protein n=1 Tax=Calothrix sp. NIES-2100 TaxID=1954172 RepID=UPI000B5E7C8B|nr:hypothetical protein NIES2100_28880 [Calothrix sp. NIES-2100]